MKLVVIECTAEELKATRTLSDALVSALSNALACVEQSKDGCEERKTGRWIRRHSKMWECSECERGCKWRENYCPDCGAKMEVDE